jgi:hypothetical protein
MVNLLGSVVTIWALWRMRHPQQLLGRYNAAARFLFAAWLIYAVAHDANVIMLGFMVCELIFGVLQGLSIKQAKPARAMRD